MITYNKLVRDKIPQIIQEQGKQCEVRVMNEDEYTAMLRAKLQEEALECLSANDLEMVDELADLVEVVYSILKQKGVSPEEFEQVRMNKRKERGGFDEKLLLVRVWERESF